MPIAILCCERNGVYSTLDGVECYDESRDVRTFTGGMPVVAHPPCRTWSAFCAHQAKAPPGEKELGPLCVEWLRKCGGVLEHPAHSRLFSACGLPRPGERHGDEWTACVSQAWWGDSRAKWTWLAFVGVDPADVSFPLVLRPKQSGDRRTWQLMSKRQRSRTMPAMARWLVDAASNTRRN